MRYGIIALIVGVVAAYVGSVALYATSGGHRLTETPAGGDRSTATLVIEAFRVGFQRAGGQPVHFAGIGSVGSAQTRHLNQDLSAPSAIRGDRRPGTTWTKGMLPGVFPAPADHRG